MSSIIEIRALGKKYRLAEAQQYLALRDIISNAGKQLFNKKPAYRTGREKEKEFWALQDIDLDIQPGERVGVIGRNGAGKSTLLKILSRITPPTTGNIVIHGRVASLLEVGTGFHPELTGRENIYLNGSILGLKKAEINRRLDEIIDFSGVEKFIDTPLKHYSNGMQLRLAFSVAAHLEPEILLIDEVLAVGDIEFQKKCITKMQEVSQQHGRTILFVSHNLKAINDICQKAILLDKGKMILFDQVKNATTTYINSLNTGSITRELIPGSSKNIYFSRVNSLDINLQKKYLFRSEEKIGIAITVQNNNWAGPFTIGFGLNSISKGRILISQKTCGAMQSKTTNEFIVWLPYEDMTPNCYSIDITILDGKNEVLDMMTDALSFEIALANTKFEGLGYDYGIITKELTWQSTE
jgi:lipopolysaccharide transport system ATP-binding protein